MHVCECCIRTSFFLFQFMAILKLLLIHIKLCWKKGKTNTVAWGIVTNHVSAMKFQIKNFYNGKRRNWWIKYLFNASSWMIKFFVVWDELLKIIIMIQSRAMWVLFIFKHKVLKDFSDKLIFFWAFFAVHLKNFDWLHLDLI